MIKQPGNHFVRCSQKVAFESSIQLVVPVADTSGSYLVVTEKGGTLRRNRRHLRATGESFRF